MSQDHGMFVAGNATDEYEMAIDDIQPGMMAEDDSDSGSEYADENEIDRSRYVLLQIQQMQQMQTLLDEDDGADSDSAIMSGRSYVSGDDRMTESDLTSDNDPVSDVDLTADDFTGDLDFTNGEDFTTGAGEGYTTSAQEFDEDLLGSILMRANLALDDLDPRLEDPVWLRATERKHNVMIYAALERIYYRISDKIDEIARNYEEYLQLTQMLGGIPDVENAPTLHPYVVVKLQQEIIDMRRDNEEAFIAIRYYFDRLDQAYMNEEQ